MLTFKELQALADETAVYPDNGNNITYPVLGLCGEAGELANKVKKVFRDHGGVMSDEVKAALAGELGDVLWYCGAVANELGADLDAVADAVAAKLRTRKIEGKLHGSGDNR